MSEFPDNLDFPEDQEPIETSPEQDAAILEVLEYRNARLESSLDKTVSWEEIQRKMGKL